MLKPIPFIFSFNFILINIINQLKSEINLTKYHILFYYLFKHIFSKSRKINFIKFDA